MSLHSPPMPPVAHPSPRRTLSTLALLAACTTSPSPPPPCTQDLLAIARDYPSWPRVSDQANFAPTDCRIPPPAGVQRSTSEHTATHGQKLYFLFARHPDHYRTGTDPSPTGQTLVKQSFTAEPVAADAVPHLPNPGPFGRTIPAEYRRDGDQTCRTGEPRELFVMHKYPPDTPDTDQGWVYAVLSPDGTRVLAAGALQTCMKCHTEATTDRLFGMYRERRR